MKSKFLVGKILLNENEVLYTRHTDFDRFNRCRFTVNWFYKEFHKGAQMRGQVFFDDMNKYIQQDRANGKLIRFDVDLE